MLQDYFVSQKTVIYNFDVRTFVFDCFYKMENNPQYSDELRHRKPHHNMLKRILELQTRFRTKYGDEFNDIFETAISKIKEFTKCLTMSISEVEWLDDEINDWSLFRLFWYTVPCNSPSVSCEGKSVALHDGKTFSPGNVVIKDKDIFNENLQISLQKYEKDGWIALGESMLSLKDVYGSGNHTLELRNPSTTQTNGKIVYSIMDMEQLYGCRVNSPLHEFIIDALTRLFDPGRQSWRDKVGDDLKNEILKLMGNMHGNKEVALFDCISRINGINNLEVFYEVKEKLPANPLVSGTINWLLKKPIIHGIAILCFFLMVVNEGLDIKLTADYRNWDDFVDTFDPALNKSLPGEFMKKYAFNSNHTNCSLSANAFNCQNKPWLFGNYWVDVRNEACYPRTFRMRCNGNDDGNVTFRGGSYPLDFLTEGYNATLLKCNITTKNNFFVRNGHKIWLDKEQISCTDDSSLQCSTFSCKIHGLHPQLAYWYSLGVLVSVHMHEIVTPGITIWVQGLKDSHLGDMSNMIAFYMGYCCLNYNYLFQTKNQSLWRRALSRVHYIVVVLTCGMLLPIATKIFCIVAAIQVFNFSTALEEKSQIGLISSDCEKCDMCQGLNCFCIFCRRSYEKTISEQHLQLNRITKNCNKLESVTRIIVVCIEDTFISLIQLYLAIPLIIQYQYYTEQEQSSTEAANTYFVMGLSMASVISSILSIANILTKSFFNLSINPYLGTLITARFTIFVSMTLQVASRLLMLELFGLTCFEDPLLIPLWLAALVVAHIAVITITNLVLEWRIMVKENVSSRARCRYLMFNALSASASVFARMRFGFQTHNTYRQSELANELGKQKALVNRMEELFVNVLVLSEQITMFLYVYSSEYDDQITRTLLFGALVLFLFGKLGEISFHFLFVIPVGDDTLMNRKTRYLVKLYLGFALVFLLAVAVIGYVLVYFPITIWPLGSLMVMTFPFILMIFCGRLGSAKRKDGESIVHLKQV